MSESLLTALGLPDLVAENEDEVVERCAALANDRARLAEIRARIATNRSVAPLFDTLRFTRHLERAYEMIVERARKGLEPDHFDVPELPSPDGPFPAGRP